MSKDKPLGEDVDLAQIAQTTAGFTGADLENLMNEAAIMAAKATQILHYTAGYQACLYQGRYRRREEEARLSLTKKRRLQPIMRRDMRSCSMFFRMWILSIQSRSFRQALGQQDTPCRFRRMMRCSTPRARCFRISQRLLGGRVAEELIFDDITTGASNDIKRATRNCPCHGHPVWYV